MATSALLTLPTECLQRIVEYSIPESFESIALSCRTLYAASQRFLPVYNTRRKRFRNFWWSQTTKNGRTWVRFLNKTISHELQDEASQASGWFIPTVHHLLELIADEPKLARYIHTISFITPPSLPTSDYDITEDTSQYGNGALDAELPPLERHMSDRLRESVRTSPVILAAGVDPEVWIQGMNTFTRPYANAPRTEVLSTRWAEAFLLTLLPNVRTLQPSSATKSFIFRDAEGSLSPVFDRVVERANDPSLHHAALARLESFWPSAAIERGTPRPGSLSHSCIFNGIQSLRELYVGGCWAFNDEEHPEGPWQPFTSKSCQWSRNLETIELCASTIDTAAISEFLSLANRASNLQTLRWSWLYKHGAPRTQYWDVGAALAAIEEHCAESLEELFISRLDQTFPICGDLPASIAGFRRLKSFEFDIELFRQPRTEATGVDDEPPDDDASDDSFDSQRSIPPERMPDMTPTDRKLCPALVNMLPASIETVTVRSRYPWSDYSIATLKRLFTSFGEERSAKLPKLRTVRVVIPSKQHFVFGEKKRDESLASVKCVGVEVVHLDMDLSLAWGTRHEGTFEERFNLLSYGWS